MHAGDVVGVAVGGRVIGRDQQLVVRNDARRAANGLALVDEQAGCARRARKLRVDELVEPLARDGHAEQEEPDEHGELVGVAEPSQVRGQLRRPGEEVVAGRSRSWIRSASYPAARSSRASSTPSCRESARGGAARVELDPPSAP